MKTPTHDWEARFDAAFPQGTIGHKHDETCEWVCSLRGNIKAFFRTEIEAAEKRGEAPITENTSDGYHTFKELYEYRLLYNAAFFNEIEIIPRFKVHKSKRHFDGDKCFGGGWFVVMAELPTGQISNHYELKDWDLFQCQEVERANEWDKHTPQDVAKRIRDFITPTNTV